MNCRVLKSEKCEITSNYGKRFINGKEDFHNGIDLVKEGYKLDYVVSHSDGIVEYIVDGNDNNKGSGSYGNYVKIKHNDSYLTLYAHLEKGISLNKGDKILKGQMIGNMGDSGDAYGKHLHFEVWKNGVRINPIDYINSGFIAEQKDNNQCKYNLGDEVKISKIYLSSTSLNPLTPLVFSGKITKIVPGTNNPYLLDYGRLGWVNDNCILEIYNKLSNLSYNGCSIVEALNQINIDSSYENRKKIAVTNGIINYVGSAEQNLYLLSLLKKGNLKKANSR